MIGANPSLPPNKKLFTVCFMSDIIILLIKEVEIINMVLAILITLGIILGAFLVLKIMFYFKLEALIIPMTMVLTIGLYFFHDYIAIHG